ncbi:hypothetical protein MACJ_003225 [Theileria orientalis]|uniref:2-methoxy-6-polyprenyl-1,4-benzoquinol methylase, mitochondrial n=1 Tax=Theileria orientalis TaxID=68886 RepID=A0A976M797_THEOR|nr:hypothetical protein MACJ_003225 [Theileria orientalis]
MNLSLSKNSDSNFTIPSHLKFAGFLLYGNAKFDFTHLEALGFDLNNLKEFYFLSLDSDLTDFSSLNESFSCFKLSFESGKQSNSPVPLENIVWVEDDELEFKNRNLFFVNVSLVLFSKLPYTSETEYNPLKNGFLSLEKLPNDLNNEVVIALKAHSSNLDSDETSCSVTYSDPFEPVKNPYAQFYPTYSLGFGFDSRGRKHALVVSGEHEDYHLCLRVLLQTNVALPVEEFEQEDLNKMILNKVNDQLLRLTTSLEKDPSCLTCYVSTQHNNDDELLFKHEQEEVTNSEKRESNPSRSGGKKSSGKGKGGKTTQKSSQTTKKTPPKKTLFSFLPSLEFSGSAYTLNFDSKTGCLSLSVNKDSKEYDASKNKTSVNLVFKYLMSSTNSSQDHVPHGGAAVELFNYLSGSKFSFNGFLEDNEHDSLRLKLVYNPYEFVDRTILISPHLSGNLFPPWISPKKSSVYLVIGNYQYYHYTQCGTNDTGWGCCYRSIQLVCSWYLLRFCTPKLVPSHSVIQQVLKDNDLSHKDLKIGSSTWIGTVESGYFLNWYLGYTYKTLYLNDVSEFRNYNMVIADHLKNEGSPVIVGAGAYAYVILGICIENEGGEVAYLISDPHYTGDDSVKNVLSKGGIGWKKIEFLSKASDGRFINLCLPHSPARDFVRSVFSDVAKNYDLMNDLMSVGIHRIWKEILVQEVISSLKLSHRHLCKDYFSDDFVPDNLIVDILDLAGGTGDVGIRISQLSKDLKFQDSNGFVLHDALKITPKVVICDPSEEMMKLGREKADRVGVKDLTWEVAEAEKLPFKDRSFDIITLAFGLRNFSDRKAGLSECFRVLKPGGRLLVLEFSHCENELFSVLYKTYSENVIPLLGSIVAKNEQAYDYLVDSIKKFPNQQELAEMFKSTGFIHVSYRNLTGGIVCIHSGFKKL